MTFKQKKSTILQMIQIQLSGFIIVDIVCDLTKNNKTKSGLMRNHLELAIKKIKKIKNEAEMELQTKLLYSELEKINQMPLPNFQKGGINLAKRAGQAEK